MKINKLYFDETAQRVGVGTLTPQVRLDVAGGVKINMVGLSETPVAGTLQWTGADFQVFDGGTWKSLSYTDTVSDHSKWRLGGIGEIYADIPSSQNVGVGERAVFRWMWMAMPCFQEIWLRKVILIFKRIWS